MSAEIWGFVQRLWSQCKHRRWFEGSSLNRMWEAFILVSFHFCACVCTRACVTACLLANFHRAHTCVFSLSECKRRKHAAPTVNLRWVGRAQKKKETDDMCAMFAEDRINVLSRIMEKKKNASGHVRKIQISWGWSACVSHSQTPPEMI